jgi:hypothetical protein
VYLKDNKLLCYVCINKKLLAIYSVTTKHHAQTTTTNETVYRKAAEYLFISTQLQILEIGHSREFVVDVNTFLGITPYLHQV